MSALGTFSGPASNAHRNASAVSPERFRWWLVLGCAAAVSVAAALGEPGELVQADPQLAFLLRGMAAIKAAIVLSAIALLLWRFGHPVSQPTAIAYIAGTSVLAGASMLIWQLSFIALAALGFHVAVFVLLVAAWRDGGAEFRPWRRLVPLDLAASRAQ